MRDNVFLPLGLTHTSVVIAPPKGAGVTQRYNRQGQLLPFYDFDHRGASAIYSSAHDLVRFGMYNLGDHVPGQRAIVTSATLALMHRPVPPGHYGLGWIVDSLPGLNEISHTGGMPGVQTALALFPDEDVAIVVLANMYCNIEPIYLAVEHAILPKYADATRRQAADRPAKRSGPPADLVGQWTGTVRTWERTIPMSLVIAADGAIHGHVADEPDSPGTEIEWGDSTVVARIAGTMPTSDAQHWPHSILLQLRIRNGKLTGMATAQTTADPVHFALTSYVELANQSVAR
jgi:hypothetical protein